MWKKKLIMKDYLLYLVGEPPFTSFMGIEISHPHEIRRNYNLGG